MPLAGYAAGATAVRVEPPRAGIRLPHVGLTCPFIVGPKVMLATGLGSDQRSHPATRMAGCYQRPGTSTGLECAKLPSVARAYWFFYGFSPGTGEVAR